MPEEPFEFKGRYERRLPLVVDGVGYQARFGAEKNPRINERGILVKPLLLAPTEEMREIYGIRKEELKVGGVAKWFEYPVNKIDWLNTAPRDAVLFIWCAYDGSPTIMTKKMQGLLEEIELRDKIEDGMRIAIAKLQEDLANSRAQFIDAMKQMKEMRDLMGVKEGKEEEK